jgi:hypothetical protein
MYIRYFDARVYQETIVKIWTHHEMDTTGAEAQSPLPQDNSRKLTEKEIKQEQKIVGSILYYA